MALGRGHEAPAGAGGCCWLPGGPSSVLSTRFSQQEQGRRAAPAPRCCNAGHEAARGRAGAEAPRVWAGKGAALPDESVPPGARGILGLRRALGWDFFLLFFFLFFLWRAQTFPLHFGIRVGPWKHRVAKRWEGTAAPGDAAGGAQPLSEIIPHEQSRSSNTEASLSEPPRPRSPPSSWQQEMQVMGESTGWKGRTWVPRPRSRRFPALLPTRGRQSLGPVTLLLLTPNFPAHGPAAPRLLTVRCRDGEVPRYLLRGR